MELEPSSHEVGFVSQSAGACGIRSFVVKYDGGRVSVFTRQEDLTVSCEGEGQKRRGIVGLVDDGHVVSRELARANGEHLVTSSEVQFVSLEPMHSMQLPRNHRFL